MVLSLYFSAGFSLRLNALPLNPSALPGCAARSGLQSARSAHKGRLFPSNELEAESPLKRCDRTSETHRCPLHPPLSPPPSPGHSEMGFITGQ